MVCDNKLIRLQLGVYNRNEDEKYDMNLYFIPRQSPLAAQPIYTLFVARLYTHSLTNSLQFKIELKKYLN